MTHNYTIKRIALSLGLTPEDILTIYRIGDETIAKEDVTDILREEEDEAFVLCSDEAMELFLDGLITLKRGPSEKKAPPSSVQIDNNMILKKLRIALNFQDEQMMEVFSLGGMVLSKSELTPFFRKMDHKNYKRVSDRILKNFLTGLEAKNA